MPGSDWETDYQHVGDHRWLTAQGLFVAEGRFVVQRLLDAGLIPLGVTNVSEMTMWIESHNHLYGRSSSAYGLAIRNAASIGG